MCQVSCSDEVHFHLEGMLDRDQTTAPSLSLRKNRPQRCCDCSNLSASSISQTSSTSGHPVNRSRFRANGLRVRRKLSGKVKDLCLLLVFAWISLNILPEVTSKPIRIRRTMISDMKNSVMDKFRKDEKRSANDLVNFQRVHELMKAHKIQVNITYNELNHGIKDYIDQVFHNTQTLMKFHEAWSWMNLPWLHGGVDMPKEFQENVTTEYQEQIRSQDWSKADRLLNKFKVMYDKYKRLDIGVQSISYYYQNTARVQNKESIVPFIDRVKNSSSRILCSLHDLIDALNYDEATFEASDSNPVPQDLRTEKNNPDLHNWVILREYMNALELYSVELRIISEQMPKSNEKSA
ncbi:uncharacterized protein LOC132259589 [Phlebotomus argentipes]|uniref:uncharacterized protein LOC132259589 n=1 Tax=Phlebotomus argentipes TaxID=94469 RepID=UPI002893163F|nr:uncharacterized protein LOC132259589 [Phlebotomus argentipes]